MLVQDRLPSAYDWLNDFVTKLLMIMNLLVYSWQRILILNCFRKSMLYPMRYEFW
jgi:hypothetical protein